MAMKAVYKEGEEVPEEFKEHYKLVGKDHILDVDGFTALPAAKKLVDEAATRRIEVKKATDKLAMFGELDPEAVHVQLARIPELEAAAEGKLDEAKINTIVEGRVKTRIAPLERERDSLKIKVGEQDTTIATFKKDNTIRTIREAVTGAARTAKVVDTAIEDAVILAERVFEVAEDGNVVTKDNVGVTPGITADLWIQDMQEKRPHWFGTSQGGGAHPGRNTPGFTDNPFTHENWNLTKQGQLIKSDRSKAEKAAKAAGTSIGGPRPAKK